MLHKYINHCNKFKLFVPPDQLNLFDVTLSTQELQKAKNIQSKFKFDEENFQ